MYRQETERYIADLMLTPAGERGQDHTPDDGDAAGPSGPGTTYEITVGGHLDSRWADWFDGLRVSHTPDGNTVLSGTLPDQSALHGLLEKIRDLNLTLISMRRIAPTVEEARQENAGPADEKQA